MEQDHTDVYRTREWFESLAWQHRWIEFMVGWWVGQYGTPETVVDFGAGDGWWPHTFAQIGTKSPHAVELDDIALDFLPADVHFTQHDLRQQLEATGITDLSICLEVAEHMTKREAETGLIPSIAKYSGNLILFSAAQPGQPGTGHINLQPSSYWIEQFERWPKIQFSTERTGATKRAFANILPPPYQFLPRNLLVFAHI